MTNRQFGILVFIVAAIIMFSAVLFGNSLQQDLRTYSLERFTEQYGVTGQLRFFSFAFGFPLGLGLGLIGVTIMGETKAGKIMLFSLVTLLATLAPGIIPGLFGRQSSALYFGGGGYSIMVLSLLAIWYWGRYRNQQAANQRFALDLQGLGYLCFAIAIWDLCGAATMPSFALEPEKMIQMGSQPFAVGQMKSIMALFIAGWIFTLFGFRQAGKHVENPRDE